MSLLTLFEVALNAVSLSSLSINFNASYEWHLQAGESLSVFPAGRGALIATDVHVGQKWDVYVDDAFAGTFEDSEYAVRFGDFEGHVIITAAKDMNFVLHVRFLPYKPGEKSVLVKLSDSGLPNDVKPSASSGLPLEAFLFCVMLLGVIGLIICVVDVKRRQNHRENDRMEISEDDDGNIPPVLTQPVKGPVPYGQQPVQYVYIMPPPYPTGMVVPQ
jgi:hypothetical protein